MGDKLFAFFWRNSGEIMQILVKALPNKMFYSEILLKIYKPFLVYFGCLKLKKQSKPYMTSRIAMIAIKYIYYVRLFTKQYLPVTETL